MMRETDASRRFWWANLVPWLVYLLANPSGSFDFSDDAWKGIVGRATQRVTQLP